MANKKDHTVMARIGLLEDHLRIAKLCAMMLQYAGHQVSIYQHPQVFLDSLLPVAIGCNNQLANDAIPIDILILDLHLPDISGLDVLRRLNHHHILQSLPLICFTAAVSQEISEIKKIAPNAIIIEKPFTFQDLVSAVAKLLAR